MSHPTLEVADIFRRHGHAWRQSHRGHISLGQFKVMSAIERCRSAQLGGHVLFSQACEHQQIAYNSCRNRHCPKCQAKRYTAMTLTADEFIRRFLIHVLPSGFHRLRHYGLTANTNRKDNLARARKLLRLDEAECPVQEETTDKHQNEEQKQEATYTCAWRIVNYRLNADT